MVLADKLSVWSTLATTTAAGVVRIMSQAEFGFDTSSRTNGTTVAVMLRYSSLLARTQRVSGSGDVSYNKSNIIPTIAIATEVGFYPISQVFRPYHRRMGDAKRGYD